jgi:hypothetical protein
MVGATGTTMRLQAFSEGKMHGNCVHFATAGWAIAGASRAETTGYEVKTARYASLYVV